MIKTLSKFSILGIITASAISGCGGTGTSTQSFSAGKYVGSIQETDGTTVEVEITIDSDGTILRTGSHLTAPGGAPLGNAHMEGAFNPLTGFFEIAGKYQSQTPGPPGGGKDLIHVSGKIPAPNVASDQLLVIDRGVPYQGEIFRQEQG